MLNSFHEPQSRTLSTSCENGGRGRGKSKAHIVEFDPLAQESIALARPMETSPFMLGLRKAARESSLAINVGIHVPSSNGKILNRSCWIDEKGDIQASYDKLHLFDYKDLKESNSVEAGKKIVSPISTVVGRVGLMICFDLRFPEISLALKRQDAQIITYPSAFTVPTGTAHWEVLLRARAVETQAYVFAAAQVGQHNEKRRSYGHSMVIDPWGKVLVDLTGDGTVSEIAVVDIDLEYREKIKEAMPLLRRTCTSTILKHKLLFREVR
ncbi:hypothetical protein B7494_g2216 [Chlorociboria aeruginascens]|nr:hypothetical protein B7494_g2216 [Chlorociboria aeruginascens]